jgi:hypothetical protein
MIECKANFKQKFFNNKLLFQLCGQHPDEQKEMLKCKAIKKKMDKEEIALTKIDMKPNKNQSQLCARQF